MEEVKEGMLCPICVKDLGTIADLQSHFETYHTSEEDKDVLQSIKGLIVRAKRKILKEKDTCESQEEEPPLKPSILTSVVSWEYQDIGVTYRHTEYLHKIRSRKVDRYVTETNKLLIRLEKLITCAPTDPEKRKMHEKGIIPWINDADVHLCPGCAKPFNLSRRRHHCRLCGGIMCQACSEFMDFMYARKLTLPMNGSPVMPSIKATLPQRGSSGSLTSMGSSGPSSGGEFNLRLCRDCMNLLDRRDQQMELRMSVPIIVQMYQRMKGFMNEAEKLIPIYCKAVESLQEGETNHTLEEAQILRVKLTKMAENIDIISRKISTLGAQDDPPPVPRALQLQGGIRMAASTFLRENLLGLPQPPSEIELEKLQSARKEKVLRDIRQEKAAAAENQQPIRVQKLPLSMASSTESAQGIELDTGWSPDSVSPKSLPSDDPMIQQMNIIRNYIRQAKEAQKFDEVAMLEANLQELQKEYRNQALGSK